MSMTFRFCVVAGVGLVAGCGVGTVSGEIDGREVPAFSTAAFGGVEADNGFALFGYALPGDSCEDGAAFALNAADRQQAVTDDDLDDFNSSVDDLADLTNDVLPTGEWFAGLIFIGQDIDDVREETFDVEDLERDEVAIQLQFCLQEDEAETETVDGQATLESGADCFAVGEGELTFVLNDDDSQLRVFSEDEVEVQFGDGDKAGDVTVDITFSGCKGIGDAADEFLGAF